MTKPAMICAGLALLAAPASAAADTAAEAAAKFGARETIQQISLSPDGKRVAFIQPAGPRGARLFVASVDNGVPTSILSSSGNPDKLSECHWSTNVRLVCQIYFVLNDGSDNRGFIRMVALDADGKNLKMISARTNLRATYVAGNGGGVIDWLGDGDKNGNTILMTRAFVPEDTAGTLLSNQREGLGVERVDTMTLQRGIVEKPRGDAAEFYSDGHGVIRLVGYNPKTGTGYDSNRISYFYRKSGESTLLPFGTLQTVGGKTIGFNPYAVDRTLNVAYGFEASGGRLALYRVSLDGTLAHELVYARPDVDVDGLVRIGRERRVVGVSFATDRRQNVFFDPELKKLGQGLSRALPGLPLVYFIDASADEKQLLLWAGSDVDPGHFYLFDKTTKKLGEVMPARAELAQTTLAKVTAVTFPAADGTKIPGYLTLPPGSNGKNLPAIVMPHGGPGDRDEWGFDWMAQFFANRGYAVLQLNFRGSTGYGEGWFKENGFKSWRTAIGDVNDGGHWLSSQGIAAPGKLAIVGWSYGGYAALQSAVLDPTLFKAIIAIAPVTDLEQLRTEASRFTNGAAVSDFIGQGPHVREGSPAQNAGRIAAPVLMFHGDKDQHVQIEQSRTMASRLRGAGKKVELVEYKDLTHSLIDSAARAQMLGKSDAFLRQSLGLSTP